MNMSEEVDLEACNWYNLN